MCLSHLHCGLGSFSQGRFKKNEIEELVCHKFSEELQSFWLWMFTQFWLLGIFLWLWREWGRKISQWQNYFCQYSFNEVHMIIISCAIYFKLWLTLVIGCHIYVKLMLVFVVYDSSKQCCKHSILKGNHRKSS